MRNDTARLRDPCEPQAAKAARTPPSTSDYGRAGFAGLVYSDGGTAERHLADAIGRRARPWHLLRTTLRQAIVDWPSEYHLSRERHCIVRPLSGIRKSDGVLELGCGCGAVTRYLGEIGAVVTAVEGAPQRARIAAERCGDLPNVTVFNDDVLAFESDARFDWVLLIGVLEYAAVFSAAADPAGQMLRKAAGLLATDGRLAVAIENKLGLKYFAGCAEDHVGIPFYGVQGLYDARTPRTFGRDELGRAVNDAGLPHAAFLYPFPDYKLPRIVLCEAALHDPDFDAAGALAHLQSRDYGGSPARLFSEALVAAEAASNDLLGALSNAFLVVASRRPLPADPTLGFAFAPHRDPDFATQTCFVRRGGRSWSKDAPVPRADAPRVFADGSMLQHVTGATEYVPGPLALRALSLARTRRGDLATIVEALLPWLDFLLRHAKSPGRRLSDLSLAGEYVDMTPFNIVATPEGLVPIDVEWRVDRDIALGWVVTRATVHSLCGMAGFERKSLPIADVVEALCARRALAVSRDEIAGWLAQENEFQTLSMGRKVTDCSLTLSSWQLVPQERTSDQERRALQGELDLIHRSRSSGVTPRRCERSTATGGASQRLLVPRRARSADHRSPPRRFRHCDPSGDTAPRPRRCSPHLR